MDKLTGQIVNKSTITGTIYVSETVYIHDRLPDYEGEYAVTPKVDEQTLDTKDRSMVEDVTVNPIPYHEVSNLYGITVSIGS